MIPPITTRRAVRWTSVGFALFALAFAPGCAKTDDSAVGDAASTTFAPIETQATGLPSSVDAGCVPAGDPGEATDSLKVVLKNWSVEPSKPTAKAGRIAFVADNQSSDAHSLDIVRADSWDAIPKTPDGAADDTRLNTDPQLFEVASFPGGSKCVGVFNLDPGKYVLFCNVVDTDAAGKPRVHPTMGMHTTFTVE